MSDDEDDNKEVDKGENPEGNEKQKETEEEAASEGVDTEAKAASHPHHTEEDVHRTETERGDGETTEVTDQKLSADLSEVTNKDKEWDMLMCFTWTSQSVNTHIRVNLCLNMS